MSQTSWQKQQQHLQTLQSMVNGVLIETGKALRSANKKGIVTIGQADNRLQVTLPVSLGKFHLALDELESDIVRAKAVLRRDLQELQTKRNQLKHTTEEQAEDMMDITQDRRSTQEPSPWSEGLVPSEAVPDTQHLIKSENNVVGDTLLKIVTSPTSKAEPPSSSMKSPQETQNEIKSQPKHSSEANAADSQDKMDPSSIVSEGLKNDVTEGLGIVTSDPVPVAVLEAPEAIGLQNTDFDSIFGANNNGNTDLTLDDFDFSANNSGNQNRDFVSNDDGFDLSTFGNQDSNENGASISLLQGLDSFGNGSASDFAMPDISNTTTNQGGVDNSGGDFAIGGDLDLDLSMGNESNFHDLLIDMDFGDGLDDGTQNSMEHGEFDDAFFSLTNDG